MLTFKNEKRRKYVRDGPINENYYENCDGSIYHKPIGPDINLQGVYLPWACCWCGYRYAFKVNTCVICKTHNFYKIKKPLSINQKWLIALICAVFGVLIIWLGVLYLSQ